MTYNVFSGTLDPPQSQLVFIMHTFCLFISVYRKYVNGIFCYSSCSILCDKSFAWTRPTHAAGPLLERCVFVRSC